MPRHPAGIFFFFFFLKLSIFVVVKIRARTELYRNVTAGVLEIQFFNGNIAVLFASTFAKFCLQAIQ